MILTVFLSQIFIKGNGLFKTRAFKALENQQLISQHTKEFVSLGWGLKTLLSGFVSVTVSYITQIWVFFLCLRPLGNLDNLQH